MAAHGFSSDILLTAGERTTLEQLARACRTRADLARRARIILRLADGASYLDMSAAWARVRARSANGSGGS